MEIKLEKMNVEKIVKNSGVTADGKPWERTEVLFRDLHSQVETRLLARIQKRVLEAFPNIKEGDEYDVFININCREWEGKYFNEINCWKLEIPSTF